MPTPTLSRFDANAGTERVGPGATLVHAHHGPRYPGDQARPASEQQATTALAWVAAREGKTLVQLVHELHAPGSSDAAPGSSS
jgi:hypothetical protein